MFIERSAARIRLARTLFVLLGVFPCAGLCGWAAMRHSSGHRDTIERRCEQAIGLPFRIGRVEHVRPNAMRWHECQLVSAAGAVVLTAPVIEVESLPHEIRLTLVRLDGTPALARVLVGIAEAWLRQPVRFPVDCVVDVDDFSWQSRSPAGPGEVQTRDHARTAFQSRGLHVECVAANGSRAVRVRRNDDGSGPADEVRVVAGSRDLAAGHDEIRQADTAGESDTVAPRLEVSGSVSEPLPIAMLEAVCGLGEGALPLGDEATVSGTIDAVFDEGLSSGSAQARVERVDLATASLHLPHRVSGEASLAIEKLEWSRNTITNAACQGTVSRGRLGQRLLDACVSMLGCRPGPAFRSLAQEEVRRFDDLGAMLRIGPGGADLRASPGWDGSLARIQGLSILDEPPSVMPLDRLAWLLSPPGAPAVPASRATAWMLDWFPVYASGTASPLPRVAPATPAGGQGAESLSPQGQEQAVRPLQRSEF